MTSRGTESTACWYSAMAALGPPPSPRSALTGPFRTARSGNSSSKRAAADTSAADAALKVVAAEDKV